MLTAARCERLIRRWPQTTAKSKSNQQLTSTGMAKFYRIKITFVIPACCRVQNFAECFYTISANKPFFFLTLTSWQGASPPGRGDVWEGTLVILIFKACKPPLIVMLCWIPPHPLLPHQPCLFLPVLCYQRLTVLQHLLVLLGRIFPPF